ncbi:MAG: hypothetical protein ABL973_19815 [Micropepsaceae bacterium]
MVYESANGDLVGWIIASLVLVGSMALAAAVCRRPASALIFILAVALRFGLSAASSFGLFLPPDADRLDFHLQASQMATTEDDPGEVVIGHQVYTAILALFYRMFGTSIFLGCIVSTIPFVFAQVYLLRFLRFWGYDKFETMALLLFGFAPAMLLYANFTYREPLQILLMLMGLYYGFSLRRNPSLGNVLLCTLSLFAFGMLHSKFFVVVPLILILIFFWPPARPSGQVRSRRKSALPSIVAGLIVVTLAVIGVLSQSSSNSLVDTLTTGNVADYMLDQKYALQGIAPRTMMPIQIESASVTELILKAPLILLQYMFAPIAPFLVQEAQDLVALADTVLRSILLFSAISEIRRSRSPYASELRLLLVIYVVFSLVAALGTAAVGTAIRHQIKVSWILVLLGTPGLARMIRSLLVGPRRPE